MKLELDINNVQENIILIDEKTSCVIFINKYCLDNIENISYIKDKNINDIFEDTFKKDNLKKPRYGILKINDEQINCTLKYKYVSLPYIALEIIILDPLNTKFISEFSDGLKDIMNTILINFNHLKKTKLTNEQKKYIKLIENVEYNLIRIVNDFLDYNIIQNREMKIKKQPFDLNKSIEKAENIFVDRNNDKIIKTIHYIDKDIPKFIIGDEKRVVQIFVNVFDNILNHSGKNEILTDVNIITKGDKFIKIIIIIKNNCSGILCNKIVMNSQYKNIKMVITKYLCEIMGGDLFPDEKNCKIMFYLIVDV